jgi:exosortase A
MSSVPAEQPVGLATNGFRTAALLGAVVAVVILGIFHETVAEIVSIWDSSETYAHGYVVVPISLWLLWSLRHRLERLPLQPTWLPLIPLAGAGFGWLVGEAAGVAALTQFSLVAMVICALWAVWGHAVARAAVFPLAFFFFGVPFGEFLQPFLMQHTADFTVSALSFSGIPVYREGLQFIIPSGRWSVVEACSGIRYLLASVMVGVLFAYLNYSSLKRRLLFVLASILVPLVANWLRAYLIVMLGHLSGNRLATGVDHLIYGWFFFGLVILALFWVGSWWREAERPLPEMTDGATMAMTRAEVVRRALPSMLAAVCIAGVWLPIESWLENVPMAADYRLEAPEGRGGWVLTHGAPVADWLPHYIGERAQMVASYRKEDKTVTLFASYYARQTKGRELVQWDNRNLFSNDKVWSQVEEGGVRALPGLDARRALISGADRHLSVWTWYWLGHLETTDERRAKLALASDRLARRNDDSAAIVLWSSWSEDPRQADAAMRDFLESNHDAILGTLVAAPRN